MRSKTIETAIDQTVARMGAVAVLVIVALAMMLPGFVTLPPMDRDEPRFAQASKQMLETGDFVDIRFGDEARNKKPVGIHWMQAAVVGLADLAQVPDAHQKIWLYRLPSLVGAVCAVLLTYWAALPFVSRFGAVIAGLLIAATPLLGAEARLATTDAVLVATVAAAMGALSRVYLAQGKSRDDIRVPIVFWIAVGIGILIKGPINPMIVIFAATSLSLKNRSVRWLGRLRPLPGLALCLLIVIPWFALILVKTGGTFFTEAVGHDLLGKVAGAQEMHGAPPGFYLATFFLTGWPLAPFAVLAMPTVWRHRQDPRVQVLAAWVVPAWLLFEAVPTKLVHYALPLFPAIAIVAVFGLERALRTGREFGAVGGWILFALLAIVPAVVVCLTTAGQGLLWTLTPVQTTVSVLVMFISVFLLWNARRALVERSPHAAAGIATFAALPVYLFVAGWLLSPDVASGLAVSPRLAQAASHAFEGACTNLQYATVGSREPSLMFATNAKLLMTDPAGAARFLENGSCRVAFVEGREEPAFKAQLDPALSIQEASRVEGIAVNGGRKLDIGVYIRKGVAP